MTKKKTFKGTEIIDNPSFKDMLRVVAKDIPFSMYPFDNNDILLSCLEAYLATALREVRQIIEERNQRPKEEIAEDIKHLNSAIEWHKSAREELKRMYARQVQK